MQLSTRSQSQSCPSCGYLFMMNYSDYTDLPAPPYSRKRSTESDDGQDKAREPEPPKRETMSQWLQNQASSHKVQLAATAVASGLLVAGAIFGAQALRRQVIIEDIKASIPKIDEDQKVCWPTLPRALIHHPNCLSEASRLWTRIEHTWSQQGRPTGSYVGSESSKGRLQ